ncbi:hypothetical protein H6769_04765 [Candidatus Peribacteria bacterium]|nr:hypothetical protein [Candidatus Peribacteria bacterium]
MFHVVFDPDQLLVAVQAVAFVVDHVRVVLAHEVLVLVLVLVVDVAPKRPDTEEHLGVPSPSNPVITPLPIQLLPALKSPKAFLK